MAIIEVLKWDAPPNVFAFKFPCAQLNTKSQLIVSESQEAVFVKEGQYYGPFKAGRHTLDTNNYPFLTKFITGAVSGWKSPFTAEVWFVQKAIPLNIMWGTSDPIQIEDARYHIILPVRAFGQYGIQITNSMKFLAKLNGQLPAFTTSLLTSYFKGIIITLVKDCLGNWLIEKDLSVLQISNKLREISAFLEEQISGELENYGVRVVSFMVNSISTDNNDPGVQQLKKAMAKKAEMNIIGYTYQQERSFDTMETAAGNQGTGGTLMNAGIGLGMGMGLGTPMANMAGNMTQNLQSSSSVTCKKCGKQIHAGTAFCPSCGASTKQEDDSMIECDKCGTKSPAGTKFCPNCGDVFYCCPSCGADNPETANVCRKCGKPLPQKCPACHSSVSAGVKFCPECGHKMVKQCPQCNQEIQGMTKFCPNCGAKIEQ